MVRESDLRRKLRTWARSIDCIPIPLFGSPYLGKGWPDYLVLIGPAPYQIAFLELKSQKGTYRPAQIERIRWLRGKGIPAWGIRTVTQFADAVDYVRKGLPVATEASIVFSFLDDLIAENKPEQAAPEVKRDIQTPPEEEASSSSPPQSVGEEDLVNLLKTSLPEEGAEKEASSFFTAAPPVEGVVEAEVEAPIQDDLNKYPGPSDSSSWRYAQPPVAFGAGGILESYASMFYRVEMLLEEILKLNREMVRLLRGDAEDTPTEEAEPELSPEAPKRRGRGKKSGA